MFYYEPSLHKGHLVRSKLFLIVSLTDFFSVEMTIYMLMTLPIAKTAPWS